MNRYSGDRKYIIIPEYAPLYAMEYCWGPTMGPLTKPTLTPVDVIGKLLLQSGKEKLTIFEVIKLSTNSFSEPVQLTLDNYKLSYETIKNGLETEVPPDDTFTEVTPDLVVTVPNIETDPNKNFDALCDSVEKAFGEDHVTGDKEPTYQISDDKISDDVTTASSKDHNQDENTITNKTEIKKENAPSVETTVGNTEQYSGMSRAERRAAKKHGDGNQAK